MSATSETHSSDQDRRRLSASQVAVIIVCLVAQVVLLVGTFSDWPGREACSAVFWGMSGFLITLPAWKDLVGPRNSDSLAGGFGIGMAVSAFVVFPRGALVPSLVGAALAAAAFAASPRLRRALSD